MWIRINSGKLQVKSGKLKKIQLNSGKKTLIGATAVGVTAAKNDLQLWTIINIGSTIILWWSLFYIISSLLG